MITEKDTEVGNSREELLAASAALKGLTLTFKDSVDAARVVLRAIAYEDRAKDAPPISVAGQVTDDRLLDVIGLGIVSGIVKFLTATSVVTLPPGLPLVVAESLLARVIDDPTVRHELLEGARHALVCDKNHFGPGAGPTTEENG